ncbi:MAG: hypothetical protein KKB50_01395 [Planctomycetes bacterium]|nr:hypothetical protein [Planctomycetota bacterium]
MGTMTKVFVVLTAVLAIAVSCLFISAAAQWDNWKKLAEDYRTLQEADFLHRLNVEASMQATLAMKDDALAAKDAQIEKAQGEIQNLADDTARLQSDLARARNDAISFEASRTKLQEILAVTTGELKALQRQNQSLLTDNIDLQTRNGRLNGRVLELTANVTILTDEVRNLQEKLYAAEQQVGDWQQRVAAGGQTTAETVETGAVAAVPTVAGPIHGEIIDIEGTYASVNIGETSGVVPGMTFMIWRDDVGYIGDLVIDKVRPKEAGGKLTTLVKGDVQRGDPVVYGLD